MQVLLGDSCVQGFRGLGLAVQGLGSMAELSGLVKKLEFAGLEV